MGSTPAGSAATRGRPGARRTEVRITLLAIMRDQFNHLALECRSTQNCQHTRIVRALGITNDQVYAETPDCLIERLGRFPIQPASFASSTANGNNEAGASVAEAANSEGAPALSPDAPPESCPPDEMSAKPVNDGAAGVLAASSTPGGATIFSADGSGVSLSWQALAPFQESLPEGATSPFEQILGSALEFLASRRSSSTESGPNPERPSAVQALTRLTSTARLFRSADGRYCAQVTVGDRLEIYSLRSAGFRDWFLLIDAQACPVLALPGSTEDLMATAVNGWLLLYENLTAIPGWFSDCVCQLAFGGGFARRTFYTNDERSVIYAQRPVVLVGIGDFVVRGDLRDRSVFLHLPPIPETSMLTERTFWPEFRADYPRILGAMLGAIVGGLRELPSVHLKKLPRMADYAEWGEATGRGLGWGAGTFLSAYDENRKRATDLMLEDSPVATLVFALAGLGVNWSGTVQQLYERITKTAGNRLGSNWPKNYSTFGAELRRIAPQLRVHGISVNFERTRDARIVTVRAERSKADGLQPNAPGP